MKILVIGHFVPDHFGAHIAETFEEMGHCVQRFEVRSAFLKGKRGVLMRGNQIQARFYNLVRDVFPFRNCFEGRLLKHVRDFKPDLILVCHDLLQPSLVEKIRSVSSAHIVLWFPDSIGNFRRAMFLVASYDCLFFKDPYIVLTLSRILKNKKIYYLPECCNPKRHYACVLTEKERIRYQCDITTAGNLHSYRIAFFEQLKDYQVKIWGPPPPLWMGESKVRSMWQGCYVANEEKCKVFQAAKMVVNNLLPWEIYGLNARAFEACAAGAFQLVDWRPALDQFFEEGKELVAFHSLEDLRGKINYYLSHENERKRIALAGLKKAHEEHTYLKRLSLLLETVFQSGQGFPIPHKIVTTR